MYEIAVETTKGKQKETVYNINDFPYEKLNNLPLCRGKKKLQFYNISASFDIETSTERPTQDDKGKYLYNPYGFMYHWQFCICNMVVFGRTWEEFQKFMANLHRCLHLNNNKLLVIYVHNLAYEFQFMQQFLNITSLFSKDVRKPMKLRANNGFEFRCSYFLSNMSLAKFCENSKLCVHGKASGDLDYSIIRTPKTKLTEKEQGYCYNDVRGLNECIDTLLLDDTIATMPLTNTGYVRREYRQAMQSPKNRKNFEKTALSLEEYKMLKRAFRGGNTHANRFFVNTIMKNVKSYDITSSYPTVMLECDFPIGKFTRFKPTTQEKLDRYNKKYCCVYDIEFFNIVAKDGNVVPYIDIAHCQNRKNYINDNGRILKAEYISLTITNIDLDIIRGTYDFDGFNIKNAMFSTKGKLPVELRQMVLKLYYGKTTLKHVDGKEYEYMKKKNRLNSTYGMMVTDMLHLDILYNFEKMEWKTERNESQDLIEKFYKSRNNFLSYQWGVWVTANARRRLQDMINFVGSDLVYVDTDSIKYINEKHTAEFESKNIELQEIADKEKAYVDYKNKRWYLGVWDNDGDYAEFKTLGAKKYAYNILEKDGEKHFHTTVSGMSKNASKEVGSIENFKIGKTFFNVGRTTSWYNDTNIQKVTVNNDTFTTGANIGVLQTSYTLGVTNDYYNLIKGNQDYFEN